MFASQPVAARLISASLFVLMLAVQPAVGQELSAPDDWTPARTPWGDPDLQGIWDSKTQTPLERPAEFADREFLTEDEVEALERRTIEDEGRDQRAETGTVADVEGAYNNAFSTFFATKVVETGRTSLIIDPPDGQIPYTPEARERALARAIARQPDASRTQADGPEDRPADRCLGFAIPCTSPLCAFARLVQTPGTVTLYYEAGHWGGAYRTIPLDGRPHAPAHVRQWLGDSRGRWEGDTLVVETTNFAEQNTFQGASADMRLEERFSRVSPGLMMYRATIDDPATFTAPWTLEMTWRLTDNKRNLIYESACHEGNYALTSILAGARVLEGAKQ